MNHLIFTFTLLHIILAINYASAQGISVNGNNASPDPSAMLDVSSTGKGILIPRMNYQQRNAIQEPAQGLLIFLTNDSSFYYHHSGVWFKIPNEKNASDIWIDQNGNIIGRNSASQVLNGSHSVSIGHNALNDNNGSSNFINAIGYEAAMNDQTSGDAFINAMGFRAAHSNIGTNVNAIGFRSAYNNSGDLLTAVGHMSGLGNTGYAVDALGAQAAEQNTGDWVEALGLQSARFNTGDIVQALGTSSAVYNSGDYVVAVGNGSAYNNTHNYVNVIGSYTDDAPQHEATILTGDLFLKDPFASGGSTTGTKIQFGNGTILETPAADVLQITDVLRLTPRPTAPATPVKGMIYFDDTLSKLMVWDGIAWQACW